MYWIPTVAWITWTIASHKSRESGAHISNKADFYDMKLTGCMYTAKVNHIATSRKRRVHNCVQGLHCKKFGIILQRSGRLGTRLHCTCVMLTRACVDAISVVRSIPGSQFGHSMILDILEYLR